MNKKFINVNIIEEYYNPCWFYSMDYDRYNKFSKEFEKELINYIENQDYTSLNNLCIENSIIPDPNFSNYESEITFEDNRTVCIGVFDNSNDEYPCAGHLYFNIYE